jgi:NADH:ubiquinone oxidoreductase subunit 2 (subunit N)
VGLLVFLIASLGGAVATLATVRWPRRRGAIAVLVLGTCVVAAYGLDAGTTLHFGDGTLVISHFLRLWLLSASAAALLLELLALVLTGRERLAPAVLLTLGASAVGLATPDLSAGLLVLSGAAAVAGLVAAGRVAEGSPTLRAGVDALRVTVVVAVLGILGMAWAVEPGVALEPTTVTLAYLLVATAIALRMGAVPLHLPAARLAEAAPRSAVPVLVGWLPAAVALTLLAWFSVTVAPIAPDLGWWRQLPVALALLTLAASSLAILVQDDLGHVLGYMAIQGGAFALLALGSFDATVASEARSWLLILPLTVAALAAVVLLLEVAFRTRRTVELRGWIRRAPATALALALALVATYGLPGMAQFVARQRIAELAAGSPLGILGLLAALLAILAWLRLGWIGLQAVGPAVGEGASERPTLPPASAAAVGAAAAAPALGERLLALVARGRLALELNRVGLAALLALALALLPIALGVGAGHLVDAAAEPIPRPSPTASPSPSPTPAESPSPSPGGTEAPTPTAEPTGSPTFTTSPEPTPSGQPTPSGGPSGSPTPAPSGG